MGRDFSNWIKGRIDEYEFIVNQDYEVFAQIGEKSNGGRSLKEYTLTLDMTKELSMVEKTEKGKQACRYFIEMEKIALQAKLLLVNNNNKDLQLELFDLIRANLLKGDLIAVSKFYFFISKFSRLIYLHFRNISIHTLTNIDSKSGCKYNKKRES